VQIFSSLPLPRATFGSCGADLPHWEWAKSMITEESSKSSRRRRSKCLSHCGYKRATVLGEVRRDLGRKSGMLAVTKQETELPSSHQEMTWVSRPIQGRMHEVGLEQPCKALVGEPSRVDLTTKTLGHINIQRKEERDWLMQIDRFASPFRPLCGWAGKSGQRSRGNRDLTEPSYF
jgi:hypothetical protein